MRVHEDGRRAAYCDLFHRTPGDVNLFVVNPGQRTCWHRHQKQIDQFRVIKGTVTFGRIDPDGAHYYTTLSALTQGMVTVYEGSWHGYENVGAEPAYVLMYLSQKYDPSDEERVSDEVVPWSPT